MAVTLRRASVLEAFARDDVKCILNAGASREVKTLYCGRCSGAIGGDIGCGIAVAATPSPEKAAVTPASKA
jgi:hypothetical protein